MLLESGTAHPQPMQMMTLVSTRTGARLCQAGTRSELVQAPLPSVGLGSPPPWSQQWAQLWGAPPSRHHPALKRLVRRMLCFIQCNKKKTLFGELIVDLVLPFQVTDPNWVQPLLYLMLTWWSTENAPNVVFTSQDHSWPFLEASADRGKISGVREDPTPIPFFYFYKTRKKSSSQWKLLESYTLAILVSNELPKGRKPKSIFAHLSFSLSPHQIRKLSSK